MKVSEVGAQVKALQQRGIEVKFFHYRQVSEVSGQGPWVLRRYYRNGKEDRDSKPAHVSPVGGATYCLLTTPQGEKFCGVAVFERAPHSLAFSPRHDQLAEAEPCQFCYAVGRAVALGRARRKMAHRKKDEKEQEPENFELPLLDYYHADVGTVELTAVAV